MTDPPISEFMNRKPLWGAGHTPIAEVTEAMLEHAGGAFVVCENGVPIGIVTESDTLEVLHDTFSGHDCRQLSAQSIMASPIQTLPESAPMSEIIALTKTRFFRRVPIVDDKNKITGIVNLVELQRAMNEVLDKRRSDLEQAVEERTRELKQANHQLEQLAVHDGLTGLLNRRAMDQQLEKLSALTARYGNRYSVILCDIDHFKLLNDSLGHVEGDEILCRVANTLSRSVRATDLVYRYGGEEFLVVLPETSLDGALDVAQRIRESIEAAKMPHPDSATSKWVTISLGVREVFVDADGETETWIETVEHADRALYLAKQKGRNRVLAARPDENPGNA